MLPSHPTPFTSESNRVSAISRFEQILTYFENNNDDINLGYYDKVKLVKFTYAYARNQSSRDLIVLAALGCMRILESDSYHVDLDDANLRYALKAGLYRFANILLQNFFLPLKALAREKRKPPPSHVSEFMSERGFRMSSETRQLMDRFEVASLRHRCRPYIEQKSFQMLKVYEEAFVHEIINRVDRPISSRFDIMDITRILPPSMFTNRWSKNYGSHEFMNRGFLNMIDHGLFKTITNVDIEGPKNVLRLSMFLREAFKHFLIFFDPVEERKGTYLIKAFPPCIIEFPIEKDFSFLGDDQPHPRLLAAHRAIGHILHLSTTRHLTDGEVQSHKYMNLSRLANALGTARVG